MKFLSILIFLTLYLFGFDYHLKPFEITKGVDCFFGLSSKANKTNGGNTINSCYITTDEGYIVIDSGPTYSYAQQAYQLMLRKKRLPVKYVISTSSNEIHLLGNEFYKERGATLIGSKAYNKNAKIKLSTETIGDAFRNTRLVSLDKKLDSDYSLKVGGVDIDISMGIKGSNRYLIVHLPSKNIIFVGDMLSHNSIPILDDERSLLSWIDTLKKIEDKSWKRIISAHGIRTKRSALNSTKNYLTTLKKQLTKSIKNRVDKSDSIESIKMSKFKEERLYDEWHKKNIAIAYSELKKIVKPTPLPIVVASLPVSNQIKEKKSSKKVIKKKEVKAKKPKIKKSKPKKEKIKITKTEKSKKVKKKKREKIPPITTYYSYETAKYYAKKEKKIVLLKVRSNHCPFCDELDSVMQGSRSIRKIVNQNFKMIYLNVSMGKLPLGIRVKKIPSLVLIRPDSEKVVRTITNFKSVGELLNMLKAGVRDGKVGGYLK
jgi:glyoxylase-like metal-dependent hydrolase (beta-lactamase superfamily II)